MNQLLLTIGIVMFMLTVYGTVVIGGYLLKVSQESENLPDPATTERSLVERPSLDHSRVN